jgi:ankyrin repeat protein
MIPRALRGGAPRDADAVRALVAARADVARQIGAYDDRPPLALAAGRGHRAVMAALLAAGADLHGRPRHPARTGRPASAAAPQHGI